MKILLQKLEKNKKINFSKCLTFIQKKFLRMNSNQLKQTIKNAKAHKELAQMRKKINLPACYETPLC